MKFQSSTTIAACHRCQGDYAWYDKFKVAVTLKVDPSPQTIAKSYKIENRIDKASCKCSKQVAPQKS